jgi:hypothetical protein
MPFIILQPDDLHRMVGIESDLTFDVAMKQQRCDDDKVDQNVLYSKDYLVLSLQTTCAFTQTYQLNHFTQTSSKLAPTQHGLATSVTLGNSNQVQKLAKN